MLALRAALGFPMCPRAVLTLLSNSGARKRRRGSVAWDVLVG